MKTMLNMHNFISERVKVKPITNEEWDKVKIDMKHMNPFGIKREDLTGKIEGFPMGVVIKMIEETQAQRNYLTLKDILDTLQRQPIAAFGWHETNDKQDFWSSVMRDKNFDMFFKKYPDYRKYNLE